MEPFIFSVNAVMPLVTLAALGYILRRFGIITPAWAAAANKLCFRSFLPVLLFMNIYGADSLTDVDWGLTLFTFAGILLGFFLGYITQAALVTDRRQKGVVWQAAYRSNFALLGMPLAISLFGREGGQSAAVLSLFTIPLFTVLSIFSLRGCDDSNRSTGMKPVLMTIIKNPIIWGVILGFLALTVRWLNVRAGIGFRLTDITFLYSAATSMSQVASPLALISLGAQFNFKAARGLLKPLAASVSLRLLVVPVVMLAAAYLFFPGFYGAGFAALISVFASPVAVSGTVMALEMGGDTDLAAQTLFWTTVISAVTIFLFVYVFRMLGALG
ncbi:MAG: AEC family transporter [Defluviitaleaceae bacterium]|nr:AEC family transporter [Defluviitaleaceae bacterium]